jgi:hypothetical protein
MRRCISILALAAVTLLSTVPAAPHVVVAAPASASLNGTWLVTQSCGAGCYGASPITEVVRPFRANVWKATGGKTFLLFPYGNRRILVFNAASSSTLTVTVPGQVMKGRGVDKDGNTFTSTWKCTKALPATSTDRLSRFAVDRARTSSHRVFC